MNEAFYIGATGLDAQQRALEVVANNIANVNTSGFKRQEVRFSEMLGAPRVNTDPSVGSVENSGGLLGVAIDTSSRVFAQGDLQSTGKPLDIAINGDGFIELLGPSGQSMLWRGGALTVNADGSLAAANGMPLKAMISVPTGASGLTISQDGKVTAVLNGASSPSQIGQIDIVQDKDMASLSAVSGGLFQPSAESDLISATPGKDGAGTLVQGSLEASNVQLADEMVALLLMQRAYGANAQVVQAGDQLMAIANELKR